MSPCATGEELEQFLRDEPDRPRNETIAAHIEVCANCQQALERLIVIEAEAPRRSSIPLADDRDLTLIERLKAGGPPSLEPIARPSEPTLAEPGSTARVLPTIRGFRIVREIGRGGMGVVYLAEDESLNRIVALKVISDHDLMRPAQVRRFEQEAKAAARLHHTHIVPVFGVGQHDGYHYYVMQYIEGIGLDRVIDELRPRDQQDGQPAIQRDLAGLSTLAVAEGSAERGVARIGLRVAEALHYAHRQGILHRDIKPSNLLLDATGNVWVTDFGLAKTPEAEDLTRTGDVLGTIRYMAPERFRGLCDVRSDIYSLALTLYELVALHPAFTATDRYELLEQVCRAEVAPLNKWVPAVGRDLETIIHKAMESEPDRRYATAGALADDLRRLLEDRPIQARRASPSERFIRWCRRNPWAVAFLLALAMGMAVSTWQAIRATVSEQAARRSEVKARNERDLAESARKRAADAERDMRQAEAQARSERDRALAGVRQLILLMAGGGVPAQTKEELRFYQKRLLEFALGVVRDLQADRRPVPELVEAHRVLGFLQGKDGQHVAEVESARRAVAVAESLLAEERSAAHGAALDTALHFLGSVVPDREEKLSIYRRVAALGASLLAESPRDQRVQWLAMIVGGDIQVGYWEYQCGRPRESIAALLEARAWGAKLLPEIGPKAWRCFDLADIESQLCRAYRETRQTDLAIAAGRRAIAIYQTLASEYPQEIRPAYGIKDTELEVARAHLAAGQTAEAIDAFDRARRASESIVTHPNLLPAKVVEHQRALADLDHTLKAITDPEPARYADLRRVATKQIFEIFTKLSLTQSLSPAARGLYASACLEMALYRERDTGQVDLDLLRKAEHLCVENLREQPALADVRGYLVIARQQLAETLAAQGLGEEASRWRRESLDPARGHPDLFYEIALEYARYSLEAGESSHPQISTAAETQRRRFLRDAISMIREAIADGFKDQERLRREPLLIPLRSSPEFQTLIDDLKFPADPFSRP